MKRLALVVGIAVGLAASTLAATSFGGQLEPSAADTLGVVAREGECVQFGYISYIRGAANGTADPLSAVAKLGALDVGPGIDTAVANAPRLVGNPLTDGTIVLEQVEDGSKVAAFRAMEIDGEWVITEYEYSGPCTMEH